MSSVSGKIKICMTALQANNYVSIMRAEDEEDYAAFLKANPDGLLYYGLQYKGFLEDILGCEASYWIAREDGKVSGILPMMRKAGPAGAVINSLPYFGSNGGVLASTPAAEAALLEQFEKMSAAPDVAAATWISHPFVSTGRPPVHDLVDERESHITQLSANADELLACIDGSARRNIKRAESAGVKVRIDNDAFEFLEAAHKAGMAAIGGNAKTSDFFSKVPIHFRPDRDYRIYVAEYEGELCAALLVFYFGRTIEYFTPATLEIARSVQPMALILYNAMLDGASQGYIFWNWGGTWLTQTNVGRFKEKWGAAVRRYKYYTKVNRPEIKRSTPASLFRDYPGFYVLPFAALEAA